MKKTYSIFTGLLVLIFCITTEAQTLTVSTTQNNIHCNSVCNGSATANPAGGVPPYTYSWNPGSFATNTINSLCAGSYTVLVTDAAANNASAVVTITQPPLLTISTSSVSTTCGNSNGSATATVSGGVAPYTYSWNPSGIVTSTASSLAAGNYTVIVTDMNGCIATHSVVITNTPGPTAVISGTTNVSCFGGSNGSITSTAFGGSPPYMFSWNTIPSQHTLTATGLSAGTYTLTITDNNGCTATAVATITQPAALVVSAGSTIPASCHLSDGTINSSSSGGTTPYTYSWSPSGGTSATASGISSGTYSLTVMDANGCTTTQALTLGDSCKYVWPGDANDDGVADNNDILAIGVGNGTVGTTRTGASLTWIGQPSANWVDTLISGSNYKFIDCNGDGTINNADTTAVVQNFNMVHNVRLPAPPPYDFSLPDLYIHHTTDTVAANMHGSFQIGLGRSTLPANNIYGLAFTIHFNSSLVVPSSVSMNLNSTWMGTNGVNLIGVAHTPSNSGITAVGIVRTNQTDISGNGYIATVNYTTSNSLTGTGQSQQVKFTITGVTVISANQHTVSVNAVNDSIIVIDPALITGIESVESNSSHLSVGPNPFDSYTTIHTTGTGLLTYLLYDLTGRELRKFQSAENTVTLNRDGLEKGLYLLNVFSGKEIVGEEKLIVK